MVSIRLSAIALNCAGAMSRLRAISPAITRHTLPRNSDCCSRLAGLMLSSMKGSTALL